MKKIIVRYEPLFIPIFLLTIFSSSFWFIRFFVKGEMMNLSPVIGILVILVIVHLIQRTKRIAEISDEGITIFYDDYPDKLIQWVDIKSWEYTQYGKSPITLLIIKTNYGTFELSGFNNFRALHRFQKYIPNKAEGFDLSSILALFFIGYFIFFAIWVGVQFASK